MSRRLSQGARQSLFSLSEVSLNIWSDFQRKLRQSIFHQETVLFASQALGSGLFRWMDSPVFSFGAKRMSREARIKSLAVCLGKEGNFRFLARELCCSLSIFAGLSGFFAEATAKAEKIADSRKFGAAAKLFHEALWALIDTGALKHSLLGTRRMALDMEQSRRVSEAILEKWNELTESHSRGVLRSAHYAQLRKLGVFQALRAAGRRKMKIEELTVSVHHRVNSGSGSAMSRALQWLVECSEVAQRFGERAKQAYHVRDQAPLLEAAGSVARLTEALLRTGVYLNVPEIPQVAKLFAR